MYTYLYLRVSTERQEEGTSLESQGRLCRQLAEQMGLTLGTKTNCGEPGVFVDARSAWKVPISQRAGGKAMLEAVMPGDTVVMYDISRGWRSTLDFARSICGWLAMKVRVVFVAYPSLDLSTANGRLTASVMAAYAEWKSSILSERLREYRNARKQGLIVDGDSQAKKASVSTDVGSLRAYAQVQEEHRAYKPKVDKDQSSGPNVIHGYVRVSTDAQTVESQVNPVIEYMESRLNDRILPGELFEDEGVSALKVDFADRPGSRDLLETLNPGDHIVFLRPARAFRTVRDMVNTVDMLHRMGVTIHIAEGGMKSGDMNFTMQMQIMTLMAQIESEENSRRVKDANAFLREHGFPTMRGIPKWLKRVRVNERQTALVPDEEYVEAMRYFRQLRSEGLTNRECAIRMEEWQALIECRQPVPLGGMQARVAKMRLSELSAKPFARFRQQRYRKTVQEACDSGEEFVHPRYRLSEIRKMEGTWRKYQSFLDAINQEKAASTN